MKESNIFAHFKVMGMNLPNVVSGCCGFSSLTISVRYEWHKAHPGNLNAFTKVFESTVIHNTRNPIWPEEKRNLAVLCSADEAVPFRILIFAGTR